MSQTPLTVNCPICHKSVAWLPENKERPFCSERCRLIDLGAWADGSYAIADAGNSLSSDSSDDTEEI